MTVLTGIPASPGIGVGPVHIVDHEEIEVQDGQIAPDQVAAELSGKIVIRHGGNAYRCSSHVAPPQVRCSAFRRAHAMVSSVRAAFAG